jgi:predicted anti-sigma-YlaC factor YlaD
MHCDEVVRELAVPTDERDSAALAEHLASCHQCSVWATRDAEFEYLWNATRSGEPSGQDWDTVWSHIASSLDSPTSAETKEYRANVPLNGPASLVETPIRSFSPSSRSRSWKRSAIAVIGMAQAAGVLLAVGITWRMSTGSNVPPVVEIEEGQSVVIRVDDAAADIVVLAPDGMSSSVDDWYLVFNQIEAIANPVVAMKE